MRTQAKTLAFKNKLLGGSSTASGTFGAIGSLPNVCHSLCMTVVSLLSILGITISILPLMFLQTYKLYFWLAALIFTGVSFYFFLKQKRKVMRDRNFLFINGGLLLFGLPFSQLSDYTDFFRFLGLSLVFVGLFLFLFSKRLKLVNWSIMEEKQMSTDTPALSFSGVGSMPQMPSILFPTRLRP